MERLSTRRARSSSIRPADASCDLKGVKHPARRCTLRGVSDGPTTKQCRGSTDDVDMVRHFIRSSDVSYDYLDDPLSPREWARDGPSPSEIQSD
jgi:hypothetical protein